LNEVTSFSRNPLKTNQLLACPRTFTGVLPSSHQFGEFVIKTPRFNLILARFTANTYVLIVNPPGESEIQCTRLNVLAARDEFSQLEGAPERGRDESSEKAGDKPGERKPNGRESTPSIQRMKIGE
jgi:hypothetical protein